MGFRGTRYNTDYVSLETWSYKGSEHMKIPELSDDMESGVEGA